jgi:methyl coenzyme M reductase beta subunit
VHSWFSQERLDARVQGREITAEDCDDALVDKYNFFIFEAVKANVAVSPKHPETLHYTGDGVFMVSGKIISRKKLFLRGML